MHVVSLYSIENNLVCVCLHASVSLCQLKTFDKSGRKTLSLPDTDVISTPDTYNSIRCTCVGRGPMQSDVIRLQADDSSELKHVTCFFSADIY